MTKPSINQSLTRIQQSVLDHIKQFIAGNGYPPTRVEIQKHFGWRSVNSSQDILIALHRKGYIYLKRRVSRGINIIDQSV